MILILHSHLRLPENLRQRKKGRWGVHCCKGAHRLRWLQWSQLRCFDVKSCNKLSSAITTGCGHWWSEWRDASMNDQSRRELQENSWTTVQAVKTTKSINNVRQFTKQLNSRVNWVGTIMNLKPPFQASQAEPTRHLLRVTVHWRNKIAQNSHKQVEQKRFWKPSEPLKIKIAILIENCISTCDGTAIS